MTDAVPRPTARMTEAARALRTSATRSEAILWRALRGRVFRDLKFRRQHPLGPFVLDFYCQSENLAIEVDGGVHESAQARAYDAERQALIEATGIRVLRVRAAEVEQHLDAVLDTIRAALTPGPSPT